MIWIKQARGHKCVFTIHSTEYGRCGNSFPGGRSVRIREQERAGTYWADKVITVSQVTKDEIVWMYEAPESKITVINNCVNWKRFDINIDPGSEKNKYHRSA
jgi:glycosyltransferase involved in cell wall biosynthesis